MGRIAPPQEAVAEADVLVFCAPHQFISGIVRQLVGLVPKDAIAVSLTKVGAAREACA